jgi:hypothetical protein
MKHVNFILYIATAALVAFTRPVCATLPTGWSSAAIDLKEGSDSYADNAFTITSAGKGLDWPADQMRFVYKTLSAGGDFKIVARIASFTGAKGSRVGLLMRQSTEKSTPCAGVLFRPGDSPLPEAPNQFQIVTRGVPNGGELSYYATLGAPCWLQLVRIGKNYAAYRSSDGIDWSPIYGFSGSTYSIAGPVLVGFCVAGGDTAATAVIDHVSITTPPTPLMPYKTSWLGNSLSGAADGHVSGLINTLFVAPDGTCYANAAFEEAGQTAQIYKNGQVAAPIGRAYNNGANEGTITADDEHLYLYGQYCDAYNGLIQSNLQGELGSFAPVFTVTPLHAPDAPNKVAGLACGQDELYVSDAYTNQILVLKKPYKPYAQGRNDTNIVTKEKIDMDGVPDAAPQAVYQSQRYGYIDYEFHDLDPNKSYTVRLHFAELKPQNQQVGKHFFSMAIRGSQLAQNTDYDPVAKGGPYKASVLTFNDVKSDGQGHLYIGINPSKDTGDHDTQGAINGIEILNPDGTAFLRWNCGGASIPGTDWQGESPEIPERAFAFTRPGPIAVDKRGLLWIVQEGRDFPASANFTFTPGWAAVKCYDKNGVYQNKQITDLQNPTAICYDAAHDRLLVAENGPDQNIRIYTDLTSTPKCTSTFGAKGGIFSGKTPGLINDPNDGGWARFYGPTGVGVDAAGNIYVASNMGPLHTDIRAFKADGKASWDSSSTLWKLQGLEFCNVADFDASVDSSDVWTTDKHYKMNWRATEPGAEWSLYSYGLNPFAPYKTRISYHNSCAIYRRFGPKRTPFIFAAGQGFLGPIEIRRFNGEQLVPCGYIADNGGKVWIDGNGDGIEQPEEVQTMTGPGADGISCFDVADNGDLYLGSGAGKVVRKLTFTGIDAHGAPQYSGITENAVTVPVPEYFAKSWERSRIRYISGEDTMYFMGFPSTSERIPDTKIIRVNHWNTDPTQAYAISLPTPRDNPNFIATTPSLQPPDGFIYMAFDIANDKIFAVELVGPIHVFDTKSGKQVAKILAGPEVSGGAAWEDNGMGIRAHYNKATKSYYLITENSGWTAKLNLYRWKP